MVGAADLKPPDRDGARAAPWVVHGVDDFIELLVLRQKLAVPLLDQFGGLGREQFARRLSAEANPYQDGSDEHALWTAGHEKAAGEMDANQSEGT